QRPQQHQAAADRHQRALPHPVAPPRAVPVITGRQKVNAVRHAVTTFSRDGFTAALRLAGNASPIAVVHNPARPRALPGSFDPVMPPNVSPTAHGRPSRCARNSASQGLPSAPVNTIPSSGRPRNVTL